MPIREEVSVEALQRAIKARLVVEYGPENPCTVANLPIQATEIDVSGLNWELMPPEDITHDWLPALRAAEKSVASNFNLAVSR